MPVLPRQRKLSIYISGAHSVGKTTLHEALLNDEEFSKLKFYGQKEIAREWIPANGYTQEMMRDPVTLFRMECELLHEQLQSEDAEYSDLDCDFCRFLWDRCIIDALVYTTVFCINGAVDSMLKISAVQVALSRMRRNEDTHIFVPKPQKAFIEFDGVRPDSDMDELMKIHNATVEILDQLAIPHTVIEITDLTDRVHIVLDTIKRKWPSLTDDL